VVGRKKKRLRRNSLLQPLEAAVVFLIRDYAANTLPSQGISHRTLKRQHMGEYDNQRRKLQRWAIHPWQERGGSGRGDLL
jgi:hypothetical protein